MTGARSAADAPRPSSGRTGSCAYVSRRRPPDPAAIRGVPHGAGTPIDQPDVGGVPRDAIGGAGPRAETSRLAPHQGCSTVCVRVLKFVEAVVDAPQPTSAGPRSGW